MDDRKVEVQPIKRMWLPPSAKREGGSYFDDEMETVHEHATHAQRQSLDMRSHLNARPDHVIKVPSVEAREEMRKVLNFWFGNGEIGHHPSIEIDYGVPDGEVRIEESRRGA
jgi:hypothetical protein